MPDLRLLVGNIALLLPPLAPLTVLVRRRRAWVGRQAVFCAALGARALLWLIGQIGWFVNGVAFAGDYLSAASFLGICGMIAFYGYDGFLYSIGFLAGWVVALFV